MRCARPLAALALAALVASVCAAPSAAVSPGKAIRSLNAQRTANGIPGGITNVGSLTSGCRKHVQYLLLNSSPGATFVSHDEVPGKKGFSEAGREAGMRSVLSGSAGPGVRKEFGKAFSKPSANPFENAPIHLAQTLAPGLLVSGFNVAFRRSNAALCLTTQAPPTRAEPAATAVYTYPGDGARIYRGMSVNEAPYAPGQLVGIPQKRHTGPNIYVFVDGPDRLALPAATTIASVALKEASGKPVAVKSVSSSHPKLAALIPAGGVVIPTKPLRANTAHECTVELVVGGVAMTKSFDFRTTKRTRFLDRFGKLE
jgi:hypothetical protein